MTNQSSVLSFSRDCKNRANDFYARGLAAKGSVTFDRPGGSIRRAFRYMAPPILFAADDTRADLKWDMAATPRRTVMTAETRQ